VFARFEPERDLLGVERGATLDQLKVAFVAASAAAHKLPGPMGQLRLAELAQAMAALAAEPPPPPSVPLQPQIVTVGSTSLKSQEPLVPKPKGPSAADQAAEVRVGKARAAAAAYTKRKEAVAAVEASGESKADAATGRDQPEWVMLQQESSKLLEQANQLLGNPERGTIDHRVERPVISCCFPTSLLFATFDRACPAQFHQVGLLLKYAFLDRPLLLSSLLKTLLILVSTDE
jgi:hypothetical protein